jgi:hypothetical protein
MLVIVGLDCNKEISLNYQESTQLGVEARRIRDSALSDESQMILAKQFRDMHCLEVLKVQQD